MSTGALASAQPSAAFNSIDALKGAACLLIIGHHLAAYGPMSDVVHVVAPGLIGWLYDDARMAVQVFLVVGGFLFAAAHSRQVALAQPGHPAGPPTNLARKVAHRFLRLAPAYWVALLVTVAVSAAVRPWFDHPSLPDTPSWLQAASHVFLLHDVLGQSALSAGIWYIAIDLQLYAVAVLLSGLSGHSGVSSVKVKRVLMGSTLVLTALSLWVFNRQSSLDITALYFFGAYGLGMLAFWTSQMSSAKDQRFWLGLSTIVALLALSVEFRPRIALALTVALALVWLQQHRPLASAGAAVRVLGIDRFVRIPLAALAWVGKRSYSIFLIHFSVCLLFNAALARVFPGQLLPNVLGMLAAFGASVLAGTLLYQCVEVRVRRKPAVAVMTRPAVLR